MKYIENYIELYFKDQIFSNLLSMQGHESNVQFTRTEKLVLYSLRDRKMNMGEIAGIFDIPNSTANFIIKRLKKNNLVKTMKNQEDKRIIEVQITEKGCQVLNNILKNLDDRFSEMISKMINHLEKKVEPYEVEIFKKCISMLLKNESY